VPEDGVDDAAFENEGNDAHGAAAAQTAERIDLEDTGEQFGPTPPERAERRPGRNGLVAWRGQAGIARPLPIAQHAFLAPFVPAPNRVGTIVTNTDFILVGDVGQEPGQEFECFECVGAGGGRDSKSLRGRAPRGGAAGQLFEGMGLEVERAGGLGSGRRALVRPASRLPAIAAGFPAGNWRDAPGPCTAEPSRVVVRSRFLGGRSCLIGAGRVTLGRRVFVLG